MNTAVIHYQPPPQPRLYTKKALCFIELMVAWFFGVAFVLHVFEPLLKPRETFAHTNKKAELRFFEFEVGEPFKVTRFMWGCWVR